MSPTSDSCECCSLLNDFLTRNCRQGETALHIAAVENHMEFAQLLLQRGASVSEDAM